MAYRFDPHMAPLAYLPAPAICTNQYSSLQQERLYLLSALAEEEDRGERLTRAFEVLNSKLKRLESTDPSTNQKTLNQTIRSVRNKTGHCQQRERALADNLANVVAHMEGLKRYQWRTAQHTYAQQYQHGQMMVMSPGFAPGYALQSPMSMNFQPDMQYLSLQQPLTARVQQQYQQPYPAMNPYHSTYAHAQMPPTPVIAPQTQYTGLVDSYCQYPGSPAETYTNSEIEELAEAILPCDLEVLGINSILSRGRSGTVNSNPFPDEQESTITVAKLPDHTPAGTPTPSPPNEPGVMTSRMSVLAATSTGMRLDGQAVKGNQSA